MNTNCMMLPESLAKFQIKAVQSTERPTSLASIGLRVPWTAMQLIVASLSAAWMPALGSLLRRMYRRASPHRIPAVRVRMQDQVATVAVPDALAGK